MSSAASTPRRPVWHDRRRQDQSDQSVCEGKHQAKNNLLITENNAAKITVRDRIAILEGDQKVASLPPPKKNLIYRFGTTDTLDNSKECSPLKKRRLNSQNASSSSSITPPLRGVMCPKIVTTTSTPPRCQRSSRSRSLKQRPSYVTPVTWAPFHIKELRLIASSIQSVYKLRLITACDYL